ncbi:AraC family transcriptional regulator [Coraliomargarita sp. SDUM461004]|uniref:AraC family transcriptional regulator n=1 Tax=Thalassobacterium sedimentorum TaxID=3041258 RepID=A0ABU1AH18_9BACT|nr:AraC family transcriptional regulator [Coraliomargarita sp. SDUM461004]MDQ8194109.1 AraC family transcriptional regulator [Coraliomargarita sp. SDUM461004]
MTLQLQRVSLRPNQSFFVGRFANPDFNFPYVFHPEIEILYIENGFCNAMVGNTSYRMNTGDIQIIGRNIPHLFHNAPEDSQGPTWAKSIVLVFRPRETIGEHLLSTPELSDIRRIIDRINNSGVHVKGKTREVIRDLLIRQCKLVGIDSMIGLLKILKALSQAPQEDMPAIDGEESSSSAMHDQDIRRLNRVFEYIQQNFNDTISLNEIADIAKMAPASFSRFFRKKTKGTFQNYLIEYRIKEASISLMQSEKNVTEICYETGFNNLSNFNRHFRRLKGKSPTEFRDQWRREHTVK